MQSLATQLRNAVLNVLVSRNGVTNMSDDDYAFLNFVSTYGQGRDAGVPMGAVLEKVRPDQWPGPSADANTGAAITSAVDKLPGETGAPITLHTDAPAGAIPDAGPGASLPQAATLAPSDQAALPLGDADRGPEPQDAGTLLSTAEPPVDPNDPPPDYTKLPQTK